MKWALIHKESNVILSRSCKKTEHTHHYCHVGLLLEPTVLLTSLLRRPTEEMLFADHLNCDNWAVSDSSSGGRICHGVKRVVWFSWPWITMCPLEQKEKKKVCWNMHNLHQKKKKKNKNKILTGSGCSRDRALLVKTILGHLLCGGWWVTS